MSKGADLYELANFNAAVLLGVSQMDIQTWTIQHPDGWYAFATVGGDVAELGGVGPAETPEKAMYEWVRFLTERRARR